MMEGNRGSSVSPGEIIKFWSNAALIVPAEVAAPSKRGPSAFILAPLIETELSPPLEGGVYFASFSSG